MAKQDVLDAINATIVENGKKGITAQSLNNILTMIVENAGEGGSGDGALRVIVPGMPILGNMVIEAGGISPSSWPDIKSSLESTFGVDLSVYDAPVNASFAHNANVAQQILEKAKTGKGVSVVLDQTPYSQAYFSLMLQMQPEMTSGIESFVISAVQPVGLELEYAKGILPGEESMGENEMFVCALIPADHGGMVYASYPPSITIMLNLDGSLIFEIDDTDTDTNTESGS